MSQANTISRTGDGFRIAVAGFAEGGNIPKRYTCEGENLSPEVSWLGEPAETKSFALILDDPDAPAGTWNHWLLWDIPRDTHSLPEGDGHPAKAKSGTNDFGQRGYGGPCPPKGRGSHRYFFRLFALNTPSLGLGPGAKRTALEAALHKHAIAEASYMGRFERP
jgi:Raf kinase inhibitor-like YbhB/YbcL family protein